MSLSNTKTAKSLNEDIQFTLDKLCVLLEYSASPKSDEVYQLALRAKALWEEPEEE